ncbi:MAG: TraR/DksA family transcriptional regulator [Gammaproteobacteria bacterium]
MPDASHWRGILDEQRRRLTQDLETAGEASATVELDQSRVGRVSRMDALQAQAMSLAADGRRQAQLRQIDAALARLDAGTFGDCAQCGEAIEGSRLELAPANPLCLACARARED